MFAHFGPPSKRANILFEEDDETLPAVQNPKKTPSAPATQVKRNFARATERGLFIFGKVSKSDIEAAEREFAKTAPVISQEDTNRYNKSLQASLVILPKRSKQERRKGYGAMSLIKEENTEDGRNLIIDSESISLPSASVNAVTAESYRIAFLRHCLPSLLAEHPAVEILTAEHVTSETLRSTTKRLILYKGAPKSRHSILSYVIGYINLTAPDVLLDPLIKGTYSKMLKTLQNLVPGQTLEQGPRLEHFIRVSMMLATPYEGDGEHAFKKNESLRDSIDVARYPSAKTQSEKEAKRKELKELGKPLSVTLSNQSSIPQPSNSVNAMVSSSIASETTSSERYLIGEICVMDGSSPGEEKINLYEYMSVALVAWFGLLRPAEWSSGATARHIMNSIDGGKSSLLNIKASKSDPFGRGTQLSFSCCCPKSRGKKVPAPAQAFFPCPVHGCTQLSWELVTTASAARLNKIWKKAWALVGLDQFADQSHCRHLLRIGGCMSASDSGMSTESLMSLGRWQHDLTVRLYQKDALRRRALVCFRNWPLRSPLQLDYHSSIDDLARRIEAMNLGNPLSSSDVATDTETPGISTVSEAELAEWADFTLEILTDRASAPIMKRMDQGIETVGTGNFQISDAVMTEGDQAPQESGSGM